jgi:hypothetical protein
MAFSLMRLLVSFTEGFSLAIRACRLCLVLKPEQWLEFEKGLQSVSLQATLIRLGIRGFNPKLKKAAGRLEDLRTPEFRAELDPSADISRAGYSEEQSEKRVGPVSKSGSTVRVSEPARCFVPFPPRMGSRTHEHV